MMILVFFALSQQNNSKIIDEQKTLNNILIMFSVYCVLTIPLVRWPGSVLKNGFELFVKVALFYLFVVIFVNTEKKLKLFVLIFVFCQIYRGIEPVYLYMTEGYLPEKAYSGSSGNVLMRLAGAPHDVVSANPYAWVIVGTIPFIYYLGLKSNNLLKICSLSILPLLSYGLILSGSRTGLIILLIVILTIAVLSSHKKRGLLIAIFTIIFFGYILSGYLTTGLSQRYLSIIDNNAIGADTVNGRINGLEKTFSTVFNVNGIFGYGIGTSKEVNANYIGRRQLTHNMYVEALQEVGIVGFIIFMLYIITIVKYLLTSIKCCDKGTFLHRLNLAILTWVIMDLVYSLSCFGLSSWEWYLYGGMAAVCRLLSSSEYGVSEEQAFSKEQTYVR
ncbi:O-antigen ligase family protein [Geobacter pickeringii]|uniref:O-antigen ligase family protein n=1 Tax=Geobacter pickeringii TaxID=345632 RepID=UPI001F37D413|nr:O-antigen ligase family protein [Geobacter pickeringii]